METAHSLDSRRNFISIKQASLNVLQFVAMCCNTEAGLKVLPHPVSLTFSTLYVAPAHMIYNIVKLDAIPIAQTTTSSARHSESHIPTNFGPHMLQNIVKLDAMCILRSPPICPALHCAIQCIALHCARHCIALHCARHCISLHCARQTHVTTDGLHGQGMSSRHEHGDQVKLSPLL